ADAFRKSTISSPSRWKTIRQSGHVLPIAWCSCRVARPGTQSLRPVADQGHPEINPRRQAWPHRRSAESRALRVDEIVEPVFPQRLVQTSVEGTARGGG